LLHFNLYGRDVEHEVVGNNGYGSEESNQNGYQNTGSGNQQGYGYGGESNDNQFDNVYQNLDDEIEGVFIDYDESGDESYGTYGSNVDYGRAEPVPNGNNQGQGQAYQGQAYPPPIIVVITNSTVTGAEEVYTENDDDNGGTSYGGLDFSDYDYFSNY